MYFLRVFSALVRICFRKIPTLYSGDLNTELVRCSNGSKLLDHQMVPYSDHHLNNELKSHYLNGRNLSFSLDFLYIKIIYI